MPLVTIEEVADRNELKLYRTSHAGQWKAHCPACGDKRDQFHLYVSADRDAFVCQKCGEKGGATQFHAFLRDISFEEAKLELYPPSEKSHRRIHPVEKLTREQLKMMGYRLRKPRSYPPKWVQLQGEQAIKEWLAKYRERNQRQLDALWEDWLWYEAVQRERDAFWAAFAEQEEQQTQSLIGA